MRLIGLDSQQFTNEIDGIEILIRDLATGNIDKSFRLACWFGSLKELANFYDDGYHYSRRLRLYINEADSSR